MNINDMTVAEKKKLAAELAPFILDELGKSTEIILPGADRAVKVKVRLIDSGKISTGTHNELAEAMVAYEAATNSATRKDALKSIIEIFTVILMGHQTK